jgi:hypothetical protein
MKTLASSIAHLCSTPRRISDRLQVPSSLQLHRISISQANFSLPNLYFPISINGCLLIYIQPHILKSGKRHRVEIRIRYPSRPAIQPRCLINGIALFFELFYFSFITKRSE